jgi:hypothetical protein
VSSGFQSPTSKFLVHAWSDIFHCCQGPICRSPSLRPASPLSNSCICTCSEALFSHYSLYTYTLLWYLPCSSLSLLPGLVFSIASCDRLTSLSTPNSHLDTRHLAFSRLLLPLSYRDPVFSVSQPWRRRYINHTAHASSLLSSTHNNSSLLPSTSLLSLTIQVDKLPRQDQQLPPPTTLLRAGLKLLHCRQSSQHLTAGQLQVHQHLQV